jgi:uncharacterized protein
VFHDACRQGEGVDPGHGSRGAALAGRLRRRHFDLDEHAFDLLIHACEAHTDGLVDGDPTVRTCWDADRLDLLRCRIQPDPALFATEAARDPRLLAWANERARRRAEPDLLDGLWRPMLTGGNGGDPRA